MLKLSKKIALPLIAVLLIGTGVGGYFLFRNFQLPKYSVDRYPELLEYCDIEEGGDSLMVSCKALMLDIKPNASDGTPSLTSLIITKGEELKEYTITEEEGKFVFTNDILQFKKLKPIVINLQYVKKNPITYSIQSITFENIPETYIQEIVNRDIEEIIGMDKNSTTILNSFDFCPRPETLPDYVIKKDEYAKYWEENILSEEEYKNGYNYSLDDTTIRLLFACDSARNVGYTDVCNTNTIPNQSSISINNVIPFITIDFEKKQSETDTLSLLKEISFLYDYEYLIEKYVQLSKQNVLENLNNAITRSNISESVFCNMYKIYSEIENESSKTYIKETLLSNITKTRTGECEKLLIENNLEKEGVYLKFFLENSDPLFKIMNRCINLNLFYKK